VLHRVTYKGAPIVKGKRVTGFANSEEEEVHLTKVVPFLVEDELKRLGGIFEKAPQLAAFFNCRWPSDYGAGSRIRETQMGLS
jgi:hypothetical protein